MRRDPGFGQYLAGYLAAHNIPRKQVCAKTGIHPSTLSRKINSVEEFQEPEILAIGVVIGEISADKLLRQAGR
jgi:hypothetical protein